VAPDVASALVREKGLPWRIAHQIVGIAVRFAHERNIKPLEATPELLDEAAVEYMGKPVGLSAEAMREALDPRVAVSRRTLYGGPAPEQTAALAADAAGRLDADVAGVRDLRSRLDAAAARLEEGIDRFVGA